MNIKYAIQTIPREIKLKEKFQFDNNTYIINSKNILESINEESNSCWKEWLGSIKIDSLKEENTYLVTWKETSNSEDILDSVNDQLMRHLNSIWLALFFTHTTFSTYGESGKFTGIGKLNNNHVQILSIRSFKDLNNIERCYYEQSLEYIKNKFKPDYLNLDIFLEEWKDISIKFNKLIENKSIYSAFSDAIESYFEGRSSVPALTSIARFVECAESIIALPKNQPTGKGEFSKRACALITNYVPKYFFDYIGQNELHGQLIKIYEIRNNRNHGKGMRDQIKDIYGLEINYDELPSVDLKNMISKSFYIAEILAKVAIRYVLKNDNKMELMKSRSELEQAWKNNKFIEIKPSSIQ